MRIRVADPLALLSVQAGKVPTPETERGAAGDSQLDSPQRAIRLGEPVPIVFGRRRDDAGGVFISPGATEARFENDLSNNVTAFYHLVLSEGQIDSIQVRDVFQRACRVGSFSQTYNRRAGTWTPENAIVARPGFVKPEAPYFCGSIGNYPDISTLSFQVTVPDGFDQWNRQVHVFVRGGYRLQRLADSVIGPSDNFADLVLLAWRRSRRVPDALIDLDGMEAAANFLEANAFRCNTWVQQSSNLADFVTRWARYFLLGQGKKAGKTALRPLLPTREDHTINTDPINWVYLFTEDLIISGSEQLQYSSLSDRQPFVALMTWRQEVGSDVAIIRTSEVAYAGTAELGPYESHDLSEFCTSEHHAVKVGAYILSRRLRSTHTLRFQVRPESHSTAVAEGSIVRVRLERQTAGSAPSSHDYLYQVERIGKTLAGNVSYECSHFPIDSEGRSLIAMDVAAATGTGILLSSNKTGVSCDVNSSTSTTVPAETFTAPSPDPGPIEIPTNEPGFVDPGISGPGTGGTGPDEPVENPADEDQEYAAGIYFHNATWDDNVLTVRMRLAPTGLAPREDLGALFATIASTSVVALLPDGSLADPQPGSLPTVSFSGQIAAPWDAEDEGLPFPPADRVFEGQFVLTFYEGSFPPVAENPAEQLTYRATVEFSSWVGGFTDVSFLNTLNVDFVPTVAPPPPEPSASVFYWDGLSLLSTGSEDITLTTGSPSVETSLLGQPAVREGSASGGIDGGLAQASQDTDFTLEWFAFDVISGGFGLEIRSKDFFGDENYPNYQYFLLLVTYDEVVVGAVSGPPYEIEQTVLQPVNTNGLAHLCIQRINGIYYAHVNGQLMASSNYIVSNWEILFSFITQFEPSPVIAGQGRFSSTALYGPGSFTPPTEAFYVPTP
jgi:hypothetical protein